MPRRHALLAVAVAMVWGVNFVIIHVGLADFPPLLFVALRFTLVAFPAVLFLKRPKVSVWLVLGVGLFMCTGQFALLFVAMDRGLPAGLASLVLQMQVLFTIAFAVVLLGERPSAVQVGGALLALAGMVLIAVGRGGNVPLGALALSIAARPRGASGTSARGAPRPTSRSLCWSGPASSRRCRSRRCRSRSARARRRSAQAAFWRSSTSYWVRPSSGSARGCG